MHIGQVWDRPIIELMNDGKAVQYRAPVEGALTWVDGLSISSKAPDLDAVYAFLDYCLEPEPAGQAIDGGGDASYGGHGYNSAVLGANHFASETYKKNFAEAYPDDALSNLWPWPREPQWYADIRTEYRDAFVKA